MKSGRSHSNLLEVIILSDYFRTLEEPYIPRPVFPGW